MATASLPLPLGIRNNNPGNLRPTADAWVGRVRPDDERGYMRFDTPENGIRALAKVLLTYQRKRNLNTVAKIVARWAPASENDVEAYIRHVCRITGYRRDDELDVGDPDVLHYLTVAIIAHENSNYRYPDDVVSVGIMRAIS